ncbi:carotenoid biosynthesis protein [Alicyclobacillus fodiniaquatilis]|uniref:Carotenoid biosynthesis protein n=1 Tax=Alicyclobacillus fodiniaquatilis TaxID=1661150 RepID=A0ABW4JG38_9BACL
MKANTASGTRSVVWLWIVAALTATTIIVQSFGGNTTMAVVQFILGLIFVFWHGGRRYGAANIITFFVTTEIVANGLENLSIATGFPFGNYHYTHSGMPFLFQVPITIGFAYFAYGYVAWCLASIILGKGDERTTTVGGIIIQPLTAAFIMVMWDVVMDPISSTVGHQWIWEDGGGYNGVPLTNYLGWFLTVWIIFQVFAIVLHLRPKTVRSREAADFWVMPILMYGATAISYLISYMLLQTHQTITDASGQTWTVTDIYQSSTIMMLFTMLFATFLSSVTLLNSRAKKQSVSSATIANQQQIDRLSV